MTVNFVAKLKWDKEKRRYFVYLPMGGNETGKSADGEYVYVGYHFVDVEPENWNKTLEHESHSPFDKQWPE